MSEEISVIDPEIRDEGHAIAKDPPNPMAIVAAALERGAKADELQALTDWADRVRSMDAEDKYNRAIVKAQAEMPTIIRTARNAFLGTNYAPLDDINARVKPVLAANGLSLSFSDADSPTPNMRRTVCEVRHKAGHCAKHFLDLPNDGTGAQGGKNMNPVQGGVSTGTYAQRVLICRIFNLTIANADQDGTSMADLLKLNDEQLQEVQDLIDMLRMDKVKLLRWAHGIKKGEELPEELSTLGSLTQNQFQLIVKTYRTKAKAGK